MKKCLIADNNQFYLEFFSDLIGQYGYEVHKVNDGLSALERARNERYDLFIFDYVMPKIDGFRLAKYVKAIREYKNIPVILITAAALESISWEGDELYADIVVAKGPLNKMKEVFSEIIPNINTLSLNKSNKIFGLDDIYPRQIVKELLKVEVHHSAIFENLLEGVAELDESGHIIFSNRSFLEMLGKKEEQIIGHTIHDLLDFERIPELRESYNKLTSLTYNSRENVIFNYNDKTFHISFYNIISNNKCTGLFLIAQDVTTVRRKIYEIGALFNITQAFLSNLSYDRVLEYVIYEIRRLVRAINITLLLSCEGFFKGEVISTVDRKLEKNERAKINFWVNKIKEWKEEGLLSIDVANKINKVCFENIPILWFPLVFHGKYLGTLLGFKNADDDFNEESLKFFEAVGNQLAVYLANIEFFHRLSAKKDQEKDIRKEIETIVKQEYEDCVKQNYYNKWLARNKKNIVNILLEEMSNSLSTLRGYGSILTAIKEEDKGQISRDIKNVFYNPLHRIIEIKEEIGFLNKIGVEEDYNVHIFCIGDLIKKLEENIKENCIVANEEVYSFKKLADFEKLVFLIKMLNWAFYNNGFNYPKIIIREKQNTIELDILFSNTEYNKKNGEFKDLHEILRQADNNEWIDIDNEIYFFYWHLKSYLKVINGTIKINSLSPVNIKIHFS
ncbi:MAG: response regulator [Proteobacteria bacterium]|nr:response regulator [Pseudomonadota bacterium]